MNRSIIIGALLICGIAIAGALFIAEKRNSEVPKEEYVEAPDFTLPDSEGNDVLLTEVNGKVKIINFWASWSPYSKDELTALSTLKSEYGKQIDIVALSRDHNIDEAKAYLQEHSLEGDITFVYDKEDEYYKMMDGYAVPETLFLNKKGEVVFHEHRPLTLDEFREHITAILE